MLFVFGTAGSCLTLQAKSCAEDGQRWRVCLELISKNNIFCSLKYYLLYRKLFTVPSCLMWLFPSINSPLPFPFPITFPFHPGVCWMRANNPQRSADRSLLLPW